jgi:hypothetical protein
LVKLNFRQRCCKSDDALWCLASRLLFESLAIYLHHLNPHLVCDFNDVIHDVVLVKIGSNPNFTDFAFSSEQKFSYCLTPFDLLTTETFVLGFARFVAWCTACTTAYRATTSSCATSRTAT